MTAASLVDRARLYVERSNRHDLASIGPMLEADATYRSSSVGSFAGREAILAMMRGFFERFPDVAWQVADYRPGPAASVAFDFVMRATDKETGEAIERRGLERIDFTSAGTVVHIDVEVR